MPQRTQVVEGYLSFVPEELKMHFVYATRELHPANNPANRSLKTAKNIKNIGSAGEDVPL